MDPLLFVAWILLAACAAGLGVWLAIVFRTLRMMRGQPTVRAGLDLPVPEGPAGQDPDWPVVSIIVPAHDEEHTIDACVASLRAQRYPFLEFIIVTDRCTDGTRAALRPHEESDRRVIVIENDSCPPDWAGKCNAAAIGAARATGTYLLFTDADTVFDPLLVRAAVALAHHRGLGLLSLLSTLTFARAYERVVQPVASMLLVGMYPIDRVNRSRRPRPFANGQFMLFERSWYERIGGHEAVKDDLLEDIAFARLLDDSGGRGGLYLADGMLVCSMYDSLAALRLGWKRIFIEACRRTPGRLRKHAVRTLAVGIALPVIQAAALVLGGLLAVRGHPRLGAALAAIAAAGWMTQLLGLIHIYGIIGAPRAGAVLHPVGSWIVGTILLRGASDLVHRHPIPWAGRLYVVEPRYMTGQGSERAAWKVSHAAEHGEAKN